MRSDDTLLSRRERRRAARLQSMLDAAMQIALTEGLEKLTIAHLARKLDAAVGALYRYFPSKDALLAAMQRQAIDGLSADLCTAFREAEIVLKGSTRRGACLARAVLIAPAYIADAYRHPGRHRLIDTWVSSPSPLLSDEEASSVNESLAPILAQAVDLLERAVVDKVLYAGDNFARAHVLWAAAHGLDHFRKRDRIQPKNMQVPMLMDETLRCLLVGWGAERAAAQEAIVALRQVSDRWLQ